MENKLLTTNDLWDSRINWITAAKICAAGKDELVQWLKSTAEQINKGNQDGNQSSQYGQ